METPDEIWADDLLDRRREAENLIGYLESVAGRPAIREDGHAHVLAVDGRYGEGKTYFLRRFARHMAVTEHPVAFVDAWVDDLEDEPLVALAATLETALEPYTREHPNVRDRVKDFTRSAGKVSAIVATGIAKRGLGLLITQGSVEALGDVLEKGGETAREATKDAVKAGGQAIVDDAEKAFVGNPQQMMAARIKRFREGQQAVAGMKATLSAVVASLGELGIKTPITIVIDELDRCRPTYAVKLLEEVKHLFDVPGVAFVLGLHSGQLAHSVSSAYGAGFDSQAYLRRFFNRRYSLAPARLDKIVSVLIERLGINTNRLNFPSVRINDSVVSLPPDRMIADILAAYGFSARDAFPVMEALQVALAVEQGGEFDAAYLLPLIIQNIGSEGQFPKITREPSWIVAIHVGRFGREIHDIAYSAYVDQVENAVKIHQRELFRLINEESVDPIVSLVGYNAAGNFPQQSFLRMSKYKDLVKVVSRFKTPS